MKTTRQTDPLVDFIFIKTSWLYFSCFNKVSRDALENGTASLLIAVVDFITVG